ncbi:HET-domain-containing protein [Macroventuria anomochaeta]|uniref:HET-domain-containing protein n=1 Tax=Macroventuria anomochaeta TaxID=301207 RepID=A0ACB6RVK4_9PLEO|nr:HET-domain-containing protein [Macroventuria anomochaeta]KAF2625818.1 HET-domain-containing protein [Macroventuria anomochaeta]
MPVVEVLNSKYQKQNIKLQQTLAETEEGPLYFRGWTEIGPHKTRVTDETDRGGIVCTTCHGQSSLTGDIFFNATVRSLWHASENGCSYCTALLDAVKTFNGDAHFDLTQITVSVLSADPRELDLRTLSIIFWKSEVVGRADDQLAKVDIFRRTGYTEAITAPSWARNLAMKYLASGDTSSISAFDKLKYWLDSCDKDHICVSPDTDFMPKRILQITGDCVSLREGLEGRARYACLSHCWGVDGLAFKLVKSNRDVLCRGIPIADLPKTFRDAVQACTQLNLEFLWIDGLCIIQDDLEDWEKTAATMADIYRHGYITLAATVSSNSSGGCFRRVPDQARPKALQRTPGLFIEEHSRWTSPLHTWDVKFASRFPLLQRAWVYQERQLSPRTVHFAHRQLLWECKSSLRCEDGVLDYTIYSEPMFGDTTVKRTSEHYIPAWQRIVREYSRLDLTFQDDRLPAIAAVVEDMMERRPDDFYMAGMWVNSLLADLTWYIDSNAGAFKRLQPASHRLSPSWAWASVQGPIRFSDYRGYLPGMEILDISGSTYGPRQIGRVTHASINMRGPATEAAFKDGQYVQVREHQSYTIHNVSGDTAAGTTFKIYGVEKSKDFGLEGQDIQYMEAEKYLFFFINTDKLFCYGLILRQLSDNEYERVGTCVCQTDPYMFVESEREAMLERYIASLSIKEVTII